MRIFNQLPPGRRKSGFALVVTISLMVLLTILAVALLSLSSVALRTTQVSQAKRVAQANARLALMMALGELQRTAGDDRRVTADASILGENVAQPDVVGVWRSAPSRAEGDVIPRETPIGAPPDYGSWKDRFEGWLVSSPNPEEVADKSFASSDPQQDKTLLFGESSDGIAVEAALVPVRADGTPGAYAWAVNQEATKAKINISADEDLRVAKNDAIHAPARPNLEVSRLIGNHPEGDWPDRAVRIVDLKQAGLDEQLDIATEDPGVLRASHTAHARGVLADVANGGLKVDLSLAFELGDSTFRANDWDGVANPLHGGSAPRGEQPIFEPVPRTGPSLNVSLNYGNIPTLDQTFHTGAPPSFNHLRSFYEAYKHIYNGSAGPTAFERLQTSTYYASRNVNYAAPPAPRGSEVGLTPVLDRVLFLIGAHVGADDFPALSFTPVITLWNPYNVAIECQGFVVYPWMDIPLISHWRVYDSTGSQVANFTPWFSPFMGKQFAPEHGRQYDPYFFCRITADGTNNTSNPIVLEPGEVRVFGPAQGTLSNFVRTGNDSQRMIAMKPVAPAEGIQMGGLSVPLGPGRDKNNGGINRKITAGESVDMDVEFRVSEYHYFVTMEDASRIKQWAVSPANSRRGQILAEIQVLTGVPGATNRRSGYSPRYPQPLLKNGPGLAAVLETYHRTAATPGQMADLVFTVNPRGRYISRSLSGSSFPAGPHYSSDLRQATDLLMAGLHTANNGTRAFYGESNSPDTGRHQLSFFDVPQEPLLSLGGFQSADLSDTAFAPANQFGNAWASAYLPRNATAREVNRTASGEFLRNPSLGVYDYSYLLNAALWDRFFFSSIAPTVNRRSGGGPNAWDNPQVSITRSVDAVVNGWVQSPESSPLRNPRHVFHSGGVDPEEVAARLTGSGGPAHAAAHMLVDGPFNVNSTDVEAWKSVLASLRGGEIEVQNGGGKSNHRAGNDTPMPRLSQPTGSAGDHWNGFRELSDGEIEELAEEIVNEVRQRGPFQSLGEFVNRRLSNDDLGLKGALQAAIDNAGLNDDAQVARFDTRDYPNDGRRNLPEPYTGTGTPGWLTQGDVLNALGPFITVRSDTFTIRGYGEAHDAAGNVIARSCCEAVVQRVPEWVDAELEPHRLPEDFEEPEGTSVNRRFGRRFEIVSFRELWTDEIDV